MKCKICGRIKLSNASKLKNHYDLNDRNIKNKCLDIPDLSEFYIYTISCYKRGYQRYKKKYNTYRFIYGRLVSDYID